MKNFNQFLSEMSIAQQQALRMGLKHRNGGYYNKSGEFVAKATRDNFGRSRLKFWNKDQVPGQDRDQTDKEKRLSGKLPPKLVNNSFEYDEKELRDLYINGEIFNEGDWIRSQVTEQVGKIIRRGTNYLICVTESGDMFKPWIKDVTDVSGVPADQREVGTDSLRKYTEKMVKGSAWGQHFINKYRKK